MTEGIEQQDPERLAAASQRETLLLL